MLENRICKNFQKVQEFTEVNIHYYISNLSVIQYSRNHKHIHKKYQLYSGLITPSKARNSQQLFRVEKT